MRHGDDLGGGADLCLDLVLRDNEVVVGTQVDEGGAGGTAYLLPRDEVGVMLHDGDGDLVTSAEVDDLGKRVGHEIERLGGVAREDDLICLRAALLVTRSDEAGDALACLLDGSGRLDGEAIQTA